MRVGWLAVLVGCYNPTPFQPCHTACTTTDDCQSGFVCGGNGYCRFDDMDDCDPVSGDAAVDTNPNESCFGRGFITNYCFKNSELPTNDVVITQDVLAFNTNDPACKVRMQTGTSAPELCVVIARNWTLSSTIKFRAIGIRPLVILATQNIIINGVLDVHSEVGSAAGAGAVGAVPLLCNAAEKGTSATTTGAGGGGAGGALAGTGGRGGIGADTNAGGGLTGTAPVAFIRGGCSGAAGGNTNGGIGSGVAGPGGGAVYLLAGDNLVIAGSGAINASGAGGGGAGIRGGGGGAGSGGFIGLDGRSFSISSAARVFAVGGSGAAGGGLGAAGLPGDTAMPDGDPDGAAGTNGGGNGGGGASGNDQAGSENGERGTDFTNGGGGGGGGGSAGYIGYAGDYMPQTLMVVRPAAVLMQ